MDPKITSNAQENSDNGSPSKKIKLNPTALQSLRDYTVVVADTGRINDIEQFKPQDATTNPSLILDAAKQPEYDQIIGNAIKQGILAYQKSKLPKPASKTPKRSNSRKKLDEPKEPEAPVELPPFNFNELTLEEQQNVISMIADQLSVNFGLEILKIVPGYVSTEVDARLSYDKAATQEKAKRIIALYEQNGISKDRILIKIASTWEGIQAAKALKKEGIACNLTLIFNFYQAVACAQAGIKLISPFVGRILDYYKKASPDQNYSGANHPGVKVVSEIYNYFKKFKHDTIVMAASLRSVEEVEELCGCDRMTIPVKILDDLQKAEGKILEPKLQIEKAAELDLQKIQVDEKLFRWQLNQDAMSTDKLTDGIRRFASDLEKLEDMIRQRLQKADINKGDS